MPLEFLPMIKKTLQQRTKGTGQSVTFPAVLAIRLNYKYIERTRFTTFAAHNGGSVAIYYAMDTLYQFLIALQIVNNVNY